MSRWRNKKKKAPPYFLVLWFDYTWYLIILRLICPSSLAGCHPVVRLLSCLKWWCSKPIPQFFSLIRSSASSLPLVNSLLSYNRCSCGITVQHDTFRGEHYPPSSTHSKQARRCSPSVQLVLLWLTRAREYITSPTQSPRPISSHGSIPRTAMASPGIKLSISQRFSSAPLEYTSFEDFQLVYDIHYFSICKICKSCILCYTPSWRNEKKTSDVTWSSLWMDDQIKSNLYAALVDPRTPVTQQNQDVERSRWS